MDEKQIKACVDYINENAASLHGVEPNKLDVGPDIKPENVISSRLQGDEAILVVDRGIKGSPEYVLSLKEVEAQKKAPAKAPAKAVEVKAPEVKAPEVDPAEAEARRVDTAQARLKGR